MPELPIPPQGILLTHFIVATNIERSRRFYADESAATYATRTNTSSRSAADHRPHPEASTTP
jgi:hypothetical protein